jgi:hypothetical protein
LFFLYLYCLSCCRWLFFSNLFICLCCFSCCCWIVVILSLILFHFIQLIISYFIFINLYLY